MHPLLAAVGASVVDLAQGNATVPSFESAVSRLPFWIPARPVEDILRRSMEISRMNEEAP